jgi:hypothetical protein
MAYIYCDACGIGFHSNVRSCRSAAGLQAALLSPTCTLTIITAACGELTRTNGRGVRTSRAKFARRSTAGSRAQSGDARR